MSRGKSQPLAGFFTVSVLSAAAAFFLRPRVAVKLMPFLKGHEVIPAGVAAYALVFAGAFVVLSFLSHHISLKFSLKATGLETAPGLAPKLARAVLAALIFSAPLVLVHMQGGKGGASLQSLIAASDRKAAGLDQGYRSEDRGKLGELMGGKP